MGRKGRCVRQHVPSIRSRIRLSGYRRRCRRVRCQGRCQGRCRGFIHERKRVSCVCGSEGEAVLDDGVLP